MSSINQLSAVQLRKAANLKDKITKLESELAALLGAPTSAAKAPIAKPAKKRKMSAAGRARIAAAQKARWAKIKSDKKN